MPRISFFHGISIYMYFYDHMPAHFHAVYGEYDAEIELDSLTIIAGRLPTRVRRLVFQWAEIHRAELAANWEKARHGGTLDKIEPLP